MIIKPYENIYLGLKDKRHTLKNFINIKEKRKENI